MTTALRKLSSGSRGRLALTSNPRPLIGRLNRRHGGAHTFIRAFTRALLLPP